MTVSARYLNIYCTVIESSGEVLLHAEYCAEIGNGRPPIGQLGLLFKDGLGMEA